MRSSWGLHLVRACSRDAWATIRLIPIKINSANPINTATTYNCTPSATATIVPKPASKTDRTTIRDDLIRKAQSSHKPCSIIATISSVSPILYRRSKISPWESTK